MPKYRGTSELCLMDHDLEQTVSYDVANCIACGAPLLRGAVLFECTSCPDRWTYCVDCKRAWDLRPSHNQRQHNAQARARRKALYQLAPTRHASERDMPPVGEAQQEEEKEEGGQGGQEQEEEDVVTALTPSIVEELAAPLRGHHVSGGGLGGGGLREWSRHVRRRPDSNEDYQQPHHPPAGSLLSTPFARPVPNGEIVSQGLVEFRKRYSWHRNSLDWTETCARCQARWECFPVLPGHPLGIKEAVIHMGGQVGEGSYDVTCGKCNVTWHARVVPLFS